MFSEHLCTLDSCGNIVNLVKQRVEVHAALPLPVRAGIVRTQVNMKLPLDLIITEYML